MSGIIIELLALSYPPAGKGKSIFDWQPFPKGDPLHKIIDAHNQHCLAVYHMRKFNKQIIQRYREILQPNPHDLSDAMDELFMDQFEIIRIILIDLDKIVGQEGILQWLREQIMAYVLGKNWQFYYIAQISRTQGAPTVFHYFSDTPSNRSEPEVLTNQDELEKFLLEKICRPYTAGLGEILDIGLPPSGGPHLGAIPVSFIPSGQISGKTSKLYRSSIAKILNEVRDAANVRHLESDEIATLTRQAAAQEFALSRIAAKVHLETPTRVVLEELRRPIVNMPVEPIFAEPEWQEVGLVTVTLNQSIQGLDADQREAVVDLGIRGKNYTAVHVDQPELRYKVQQLRDVLDTDHFSAYIPSTETRSM
jgi:hypothetical protein